VKKKFEYSKHFYLSDVFIGRFAGITRLDIGTGTHKIEIE
jgi:hypothetical protein